jgi:prepilin-type N-terminal cleavage/methylation domain-containing protein
MKTSAKRSNCAGAGFTLVELMVVVAIFGVVALVAVTNLARKSPNAHSENAQWQIAGDLRLARQLALNENTKVQVTFDNAANSYTIWTDSNRDGVRNGGETITKTLREHLNARVRAIPVSATFTPQGNMKTDRSWWYITLYVPNSSGVKKLYVFENGHIDPDGTSIVADGTS